MNTVDSRVCTVCGQPATEDWQKYMAPRCAAHPHTATGRMVAGEDQHVSKAAEMFGVAEEAVTPEQRRYAKTATYPERFGGKHPALAADYAGLELRVLAHSMEQLAGNIAYELTRITVMDMPTARALVDATVRALTSKGPLSTDDLRYQPPLMTATEINALPRKAREYIHQLVANADPAGMVRENMQLLDTNKGLQAMYRSAADDRDRMRKVLERVRTLLDSVAYVSNEGDTDDVLAEIDNVLAGGEPTEQQKHIGYMVCSDGRYMYWPVEGLQEARSYCEDNVEPVKLMADVAELNKHEDGQL